MTQRLNLSEFLQVVADHFAMEVCELTLQVRYAHVIYARHAGLYLWREYSKRSFHVLAMDFNYDDHTTAIYAYNKVKKMSENVKEERLRSDLKAIRRKVRAMEVHIART